MTTGLDKKYLIREVSNPKDPRDVWHYVVLNNDTGEIVRGFLVSKYPTRSAALDAAAKLRDKKNGKDGQ